MLYIAHMIILHHIQEVLLHYRSATPLCSLNIYYLPTGEYAELPTLPINFILRLTAA
jgi:hypothetical protein